MNLSEFVYLARRPYSSVLREVTIFDRLILLKQLPFNMQVQTQTNWCWAATANSVSHYFSRWSTWAQCSIANAELGHNDCCQMPVPSDCNVPWYLDRALTRTNNFVSITGPATFQQVRDQINIGRPVGARIGWSGGGGHFMVIYGYSLIGGDEYFDIDDPIYGKSHIPVSEFSTSYQGTGTWTHTYYMKPYFRFPWDLPVPPDRILRKIWELRPLLKLKGDIPDVHSRAGGDDQDSSVGITQRIYSLGLDDLLGKEGKAPQPVGLRVYEMVDETPHAFFDISEDEVPRLLQMSAARSHLDAFGRGLAVALTLAKEGQAAELRMLRVPALNFEALWITTGSDKETGTLIPLRAVGRLVPFRPLPVAEALVLLREAARPLAGMDDLKGA
jgi:hypothetical protein